MTDHAALTVKQVAESLGIGTHAVLTLIRSGQLPAVDVSLTPGGRPRWRILPEDLDGFLTRRTHQPEVTRRRRRNQTNDAPHYF